MEYVSQQKNVAAAYGALLLFGMLGAHRFYLGNSSSGWGHLALTFADVLVFFLAVAAKSDSLFYLGTFILCAHLIWLVTDALVLARDVQTHNGALKNSLLYRLSA